ncbi:extensin family protein [Propylenella binzhouense]|uniref:extensin family protein n=1 Tax=Propylenella binzhouense TaxID=2555902 RepID=UPI00136D1CD2
MPEAVPDAVPKAKPDEAAGPQEAAPPETKGEPSPPPIPTPTPDAGSAAPPGETPAAPDSRGDLPAPRPAAPPAEAGQGGEDAGTGPIDRAESDCRWRLKALGVAFEPKPPIADGEACRVPAPIEVSELAPGLKLDPPAVLACPAAEAVATWAQEVVEPAAQEFFGAKAAQIHQASAYVCRTQDNVPGAKMSEHAAGNALDVTAIAVEGKGTVSIAEPGAVISDSEDAKAVESFRRRIRQEACRMFTTVLGPGTNAAHETHLHLDIRDRSSGIHLCQ